MKFGPGSTLPCGAIVILRTPQYVLGMWNKIKGRAEFVVWAIDDETGAVESGHYHYGQPDNPQADIGALTAAIETFKVRAAIS